MSFSESFSDDSGDDCESLTPARFRLVSLGDTEDLERYEKGGFHPVHLGDHYDDNRYKVIHKLGFGGFSTVWLAQDLVSRRLVALKIVVADDSAAVKAKTVYSHTLLSTLEDDTRFITYLRFFNIHGPNGDHLCLVLPVLGPSTYQLSHYLESRMTPQLARSVGLQTAAALSDLHSKGLVHGDLTPKNIIFRLSDRLRLNTCSIDEIYQIFGKPETAPLETETGDQIGSEAPTYIVKPVNFFASKKDVLGDQICLIDLDQSFKNGNPPSKLLGTPVEFLAPEVAIGRSPSQASDIWALGCTIMRLRSGIEIFSAYDIDSPVDLVRAMINAFGDLPKHWGTPLFDRDGRPTQDPKGKPLLDGYWNISLQQRISAIWDFPASLDESKGSFFVHNDDPDTKPYPCSLSHKIWRPAAVFIKGVFLNGYSNEVDEIIEMLPKISKHESDMLLDLLSTIFRFEPDERPNTNDLLTHPWFSITNERFLLNEQATI